MSANLYGSPFHPRRPRVHGTSTMDLDSTTDVHEENTTDLEPATADIVPTDVQRPALAATSPPPPPPANETPVSARREPLNETPVSARREPFISEPVVAAPPAMTASTPNTIDVPILHEQAKPAAPAPVAAAPARKPILKAVEKSRPAMAPGTVLADRYLLEQVIGCGGTAIVFRARDMLSAKGAAPNMQVAVKTPRPELGDPARATKRLKHEFEHARLLSHQSIVRVLDFHEDQGRCFMTMELVEGKLLSHMLRDWTMMPVPLAYKILQQCADALSYAHSQNVVHGDFKPGNVFITRDEGVRIVDFGTAAGPSTNDSRIPAGTPTYASPEVLSGETPDTRDDVFSFACVAYELLTGQHPFGRLSSLQARDEAKIPPRAWNLSTSQWLSLLSALSWKREQRPTSLQALLARLISDQPVATAAPVHVDPEEAVPAELPAELMPKQRSWGFFAFIACAMAVTYFAYQSQRGSDPGGKPTPAIAPAAVTLPPSPMQTAPIVRQEAPAPAAESTKTDADAPNAATPAEAAPAAASKTARPSSAPMSEISFETPTIVTSETSVAAVFLVKRSQPLKGRVSVNWRAVSGTADAGIDFASSASGTLTFADGQAQRAIYVPLRNDLLKEPDETFYVELLPTKSARLAKQTRAEAIIRDDD